MKRILKVVGALALVLVLGVVGIFVAVFAGGRPLVEGPLPGAPGVTTVKDGFVGVFVVDVGDGRVVLVDAGNDETGKALKAELERRKVAPEQVAAVFITHGHADHTGAISQFPKAEVIAVQEEVSVLAGQTPFRSPMGKVAPHSPRTVRVTRPARDGEVVEIGPLKAEVFHVPGHTPGSAAYLIHGVLFVGDSADSTREGALKGAKWVFSDSQEQNREALKALAKRLAPRAGDVKVIAPSHTGPLAGLEALTALAGQ